MRTSPRALVALALVALALLAVPAVRAQADSPADLRRENDSLRNRIAESEARNQRLEEDLSELRRRVVQLESRLARVQTENQRLTKENGTLRAQVTDLGLKPATASPSRTSGAPARSGEGAEELPDDPMACPPCLFEALKADYASRFEGREITERGRSEYIKDVRRWAGEAKRGFTNRVTWTVEVAPADVPGDDDLGVKIRVVDPGTLEAYHAQPYAIDMSSRMTRRIMADPEQRWWTIDAVFFADPKVNADRQEPGLMDYPPLIGPFAEFEFGLRVRSLSPASGE